MDITKKYSFKKSSKSLLVKGGDPSRPNGPSDSPSATATPIKIKNDKSSPGSPWLSSVKPRSGSQAQENSPIRQSKGSQAKRKLPSTPTSPDVGYVVSSRKRIRCISSSDDDDDKKCPNKSAGKSDRSPVSGDLEASRHHISLLCLKFPSVKKPDVVRILRESNFNVDTASVKLSTLQESSPDNNNQKNSLGSLKAFQANRILEKASHSASCDNPDLQKRNGFSSKLQKLKRITVADSESDSNSNFEDEQGHEDLVSKTAVLDFLNEGNLDELMSLNGCSKKKAECLMVLRPFSSWSDLKEKLEDGKHVGNWVIEACKELLKMRDGVKQLMEKCQKISTDLGSSVSSLMSGTGSCGTYLTEQPCLLPSGLKLTPYQMVGLNWLVTMHSHKLNGILGDEMGLGKTIQTIAFLAHLLSKGCAGPHVIIAPSSTIDNWLRELGKWCPSLKVVPYYGSQEERRDLRNQMFDDELDANVILTSYNMASSSIEDRLLFKKYKYDYAIFDEGHMLKNMSSTRYKSLMRISAERRLLLTGTPLQNNLLELMSLLCFLMPEIFSGKTDKLKKIFTMSSTEKESESNGKRGTYVQETLDHAKRILQPFFLRRLKADVLQQLPQKVDHVVKVPMLPEQWNLYDGLKKKFSHDSSESLQSGASMMMQLRKAANHELLHRTNYTDAKLKILAKNILKDPDHRDANEQYVFEDLQVMSDFEIHSFCKKSKVVKHHCLSAERICSSGKFNYLDGLLPELKKKGDKVLLFSQFTMMLDIIEVFMDEKQYKYLRLDGSTPVIERQELIDEFSEDPDIFVFLLSTKAGGMGINLTAANVVILHDIDFNPYNDKQAEDRCHRVGQTREVTLYRLVGKNTIEEAMLRCAQEKLKLEKEVTGTGADEEISSGDVVSLLKEALKMS